MTVAAVYQFLIPCLELISHYHMPFLYTQVSARGNKSMLFYFGLALDALSNKPLINSNQQQRS